MGCDLYHSPWYPQRILVGVAFTGVNINGVVEGRIVEHGGAANLLEQLLEIGAIQVVG